MKKSQTLNFMGFFSSLASILLSILLPCMTIFVSGESVSMSLATLGDVARIVTGISDAIEYKSSVTLVFIVVLLYFISLVATSLFIVLKNNLVATITSIASAALSVLLMISIIVVCSSTNESISSLFVEMTVGYGIVIVSLVNIFTPITMFMMPVNVSMSEKLGFSGDIQPVVSGEVSPKNHTCRRCNSKTFVEPIFCSHCGDKMNLEPQNANICRKCGAILPPYDNFCHNCGTSLKF